MLCYGLPMQNATVALELCSSLAAPGAVPESASGGCYQTIQGQPLTFYAQPYWISKNAVCTAGIRGGRTAATACSAADCMPACCCHWAGACTHANLKLTPPA